MKGALITITKYIRFLDKKQAADYAGMSVREFDRECPVAPIERSGGKLVWDVIQLDKWLDGEASRKENIKDQKLEELGGQARSH